MDMWPPSVRILKLICMQKESRVRKTLSENFDLLVHLTCGLFTLRADDRFRLDSVHLLTLLLFNSLLKFSDDGTVCLLPHLIVSRYRIPIVLDEYLEISNFRCIKPEEEESTRNLNQDNFPVDKVYESWWVMGRKSKHSPPAPSSVSFSRSTSALGGGFGEDSLLSVDSKLLSNEHHPQEVVKTLLGAVQNATGHTAAFEAVINLTNYVAPLSVNSRLNLDLMDYVCKDGPWRDAFYRFLCVEPTCVEDEELLVRIIDLLDFVIFHMKVECCKILEWIVPLCMEKGCSTLRLLSEHSVKKVDDTFGGTMLPPLLRSLFDFYSTIICKAETVFKIEDEFLWDVFNVYFLIFNEIGDKGFSFSGKCFKLFLKYPAFYETPRLYLI
jgi:hypothetical protein